MEKTAYFQGETLEFVADWLEKNNLSKLKSVFKGTFIDEESRGWGIVSFCVPGGGE